MSPSLHSLPTRLPRFPAHGGVRPKPNRVLQTSVCVVLSELGEPGSPQPAPLPGTVQTRPATVGREGESARDSPPTSPRRTGDHRHQLADASEMEGFSHLSMGLPPDRRREFASRINPHVLAIHVSRPIECSASPSSHYTTALQCEVIWQTAAPNRRRRMQPRPCSPAAIRLFFSGGEGGVHEKMPPLPTLPPPPRPWADFLVKRSGH